MAQDTYVAQITIGERVAADLDSVTTAADADAWSSAATLLRERVYGDVRVRCEWTRPALSLRVSGDSDDLASYAQHFFHEVFLLMNLAVPGSFTATLGDTHLDARVFEVAWLTAWHHGSPEIGALPLARVLAWYDSLALGTTQVAPNAIAAALFHLLHLSCGPEDEWVTVVRLRHALAALALPAPDLPSAVLHPLANDGLDAQVDEVSLAVIEEGDRAAATLVASLQARIRGEG